VRLIGAACGGFLIAVLWMDLIFDSQVLRHRAADELPGAVLASIAGAAVVCSAAAARRSSTIQ